MEEKLTVPHNAEANYLVRMNAKWRWALFRICGVFVLMAIAAEIAIYLYDSSTRTLFLPLPLYRARFIYIPSALNLLALAVTYFCLKSIRLSNAAKNVWACVMIFFLCANIQITHYVYGPLLSLTGIALFVTILFANRKLTTGIYIGSLLSLAAAAWIGSRELRAGDTQLASDVLLAGLILTIVYMTVLLLNKFTKEQIDHILESNRKQEILIEECNVDPLLGIRNRRALNEKLDRTAPLNFPNYKPYLLILSIDGYAKIDEKRGVGAADEVMQRLVRIIKDRTRGRADQVEAYHYALDRIVLLFFGQGEESVRHAASEMKTAFAREKYSFAPGTVYTFSGGVMEIEPGILSQGILEMADQCLGKAREKGTDIIV